MIETWLSGRTALFWPSPPPQLGVVRLCWTVARTDRWKLQPCFNLTSSQHRQNGCSANEASGRRRCRGGVVRGTNLAEAIHKPALWVGRLSTAGATLTLRT